MTDRAEFEALFRAHVGAVHAFALRRSDAATAEEVVADTFLVCWRRFDRVPDDALPWLYGVARRCLANRLRAGRREQARAGPVEAASFDPDETYEQRARARAALEALAQLPPKEREALQLCAWEGLSPSDAAHVAGCTAAALRVRLHRARRKLEAAVGVRAASGLETGQEIV